MTSFWFGKCGDKNPGSRSEGLDMTDIAQMSKGEYGSITKEIKARAHWL
jgi:hypothetical protein